MKANNLIPISSMIQPLMKLRSKIDRVANVTLRKELGFGLSQFRILFVLQFRPEMSQKDMAEFWDVTEASVSRQVKILEKKGWITRKPVFAITPAGIKTVDKGRTSVDKVFEVIFKNVSDKKRKAAASIFEELIKNLQTSYE